MGIRGDQVLRGGSPSQRQFKVGEEIRHILARILLRGDLHDPSLADVSVTLSEVVVSADFSHARVYFTAISHGDDDSHADAVMAGLARIQPALQQQLSKQLTTKRCPRLRFVLDTRFDRAGRIDRLIAHNRRQAIASE